MGKAKDMVAREAAKAKREALEADLFIQLRSVGLTDGMERELRFHRTRLWRFDFAWPDYCLAVEVEGLTYEGGRHQRVDGYAADCEKYNEAILCGWRVLRFSSRQVKRGEALATIERALKVAYEKGWEAA